jgi:hypothetical protein
MKKTIVFSKPGYICGTGIMAFDDDSQVAREITQDDANKFKTNFEARLGPYDEMCATSGIFCLAGRRIVKLAGNPPDNPRLAAAYQKGRKAAQEGKPRLSPYGDLRTYRNAVTWSRGFIRAWLEGFDYERKGEAVA